MVSYYSSQVWKCAKEMSLILHLSLVPVSHIECFSYLKCLISSVPWIPGIPMPTCVWAVQGPGLQVLRFQRWGTIEWYFPNSYLLGFPESLIPLLLAYNFAFLSLWISQALGNFPYLDVSVNTFRGHCFSCSSRVSLYFLWRSVSTSLWHSPASFMWILPGFQN